MMEEATDAVSFVVGAKLRRNSLEAIISGGSYIGGPASPTSSSTSSRRAKMFEQEGISPYNLLRAEAERKLAAVGQDGDARRRKARQVHRLERLGFSRDKKQAGRDKGQTPKRSPLESWQWAPVTSRPATAPLISRRREQSEEEVGAAIAATVSRVNLLDDDPSCFAPPSAAEVYKEQEEVKKSSRALVAKATLVSTASSSSSHSTKKKNSALALLQKNKIRKKGDDKVTLEMKTPTASFFKQFGRFGPYDFKAALDAGSLFSSLGRDGLTMGAKLDVNVLRTQTMYSIGPAKHSPHLTAILEAVVELCRTSSTCTLDKFIEITMPDANRDERRRVVAALEIMALTADLKASCFDRGEPLDELQVSLVFVNRPAGTVTLREVAVLLEQTKCWPRYQPLSFDDDFVKFLSARINMDSDKELSAAEYCSLIRLLLRMEKPKQPRPASALPYHRPNIPIAMETSSKLASATRKITTILLSNAASISTGSTTTAQQPPVKQQQFLDKQPSVMTAITTDGLSP